MTLDYLFSFYNDNNTTVIVAEKPSDSNTKETLQLKPLFNFIDFLHANIDNFNQYDITIRELKKKIERHSQLGFHYTEKNERDALQEVINEEWDVIIENIVNPIKNKVAELDLFKWQAPETLSNNYLYIANTLYKSFDDKDLDAILKAKRQYIEFTNEISFNVIKQNHIIFKYLEEIMVEIAEDFKEEGEKPIKKIEVKQVDTFEELVESFKAGEIASFPLDINRLNTVNTQSNLDVPYSKTENNVQRIEQTKQDTIDTTTLSKYFHPEFKGRGNNSSDYFSQLIKDIKLLNTQKEIGQVALMIYESKNVNSLMPNVFSDWYKIFCKYVGGKVTYKKSQLRNPKESIKIIFRYIEPKK